MNNRIRKAPANGEFMFTQEVTYMADEEKTQSVAQDAAAQTQVIQIPQNVRNTHNKALAALERDNFDFAIELFYKCVEMAPAYTAARRNLRLTEIARFKRSKNAKMPHKLFTIMGVGKVLKTEGLLAAGKPYEALLEAEKLMMIDPLNIDFGKVYSKAAVAAELSDAAIMTFEIMRENSPASIDIVEALGKLYHSVKRYKEARECLEKVLIIRPNNELNQLLKDTEALATLNAGWEQADKEGKDYHAVLANKEQAEQLERKSKAVKTEADADSLIEEARAKIHAEPNNLNYYINLGHLLYQQKRYDESIAVYMDARKINAADPEIDRRLNNATIAKYDSEISALREAGNEAGAVEKEAERDQYVFEEIADRVQRYPNDLRLRYEFGMQFFNRERYDEAIPQLQLSQKSPKDRVSSLYFLALCFRRKGLLDMAVMQLEQAIEQIPSMTPEKMDVVYELADIYQESGKLEEAGKLFKEIYRVDVTYRDITKKIEQIYAAQKQQG